MTIVPSSDKKRIVIIGGGFAGINLVKKLAGSNFQVVLLDKQENKLITDIGEINYDHLVIATGSTNNFFGMDGMQHNAMPLKSIPEALDLRSLILQNMEMALVDTDNHEAYFNIVVVGGGPTGVEVSGALVELKKHVLPNDYPELDLSKTKVWLIEAGDQLLKGLSRNASDKSLAYLQEMGVNVMLNTRVGDFDGVKLLYDNDKCLYTKTVIWAAGVKGAYVEGLNKDVANTSSRYLVDRFQKINGYNNIYAIGDVAGMIDEVLPYGHPMVAQVAIQQAKNLGKNFKAMDRGAEIFPFRYRDLGSMATVGRNKAVADLPWYSTQGVLAWFIWMFVHLMALVGFRNRVIVFINWLWSYFSYDRAIRLIIRPYRKMKK